MAELAQVNVTVSEQDDEAAAPMSWGSFCGNCTTNCKRKTGKDWVAVFGRIFALLASLYFFLFSLDLMGASFKILGGCQAGEMFQGITNPIAGLMVGILATVLVQSSSTSTSIVVALVGAEAMSVHTAIPVIMGANIGTSVTNTLVSIGQIGDKDQFERAFSGATVHDMFNFLCVAVLLPLELITGFLERLSYAMLPPEMDDKGEKWEGPLKFLVGPFVELFLVADSKVSNSVALGEYTCNERYAKVALGNGIGCSDTGLIKCVCDKVTKELEMCPAFFTPKATMEDDMASAGVCLFISLVMLVVCLLLLVKILQSMLLGTSANMMRKATSINDYLAILVGVGLTIMVQSSSVVTSVLTPLVGVGALPLEKMLPLTLGANIGTTFTALLAALVSASTASLQIAYCHLLFNVVGTILWFPIPFMRRVPLGLAKNLGAATRRWRGTAIAYLITMFLVLPLSLWGISSLFGQGVAYAVLGMIISVALVSSLVYTCVWWKRLNGKKKVLAYMDKQEANREALEHLHDTLSSLRSEIAELKGKQPPAEQLPDHVILSPAGPESPPDCGESSPLVQEECAA